MQERGPGEEKMPPRVKMHWESNFYQNYEPLKNHILFFPEYSAASVVANYRCFRCIIYDINQLTENHPDILNKLLRRNNPLIILKCSCFKTYTVC